MANSFMLSIAVVDASVSPDIDALVLVAPASHVDSDDDVIVTMNAAATDAKLSASSRRALFIGLGVVLGVIFVVVLVLAFTCTLKHCRRLRHPGR